MTSTDEDVGRDATAGKPLPLFLAAAAMVPGLVARFSPGHLSPAVGALLFGGAIVGAAFLLSWAAEAAQLDISAGLAIAVLAFIAVLPEYAVDLVFARKGGEAFAQYGVACKPPGSTGESPCSLALANMTGSNRLLIGVGWPMVVFIAWWRWRSRGAKRTGITLERVHSVELSYLAIACAYALTLPLKQSITLIDAGVLVTIFVLYTVRISRAPAEEPELVGPAEWIGAMTVFRRRAMVVLLFAASAVVIYLLDADTVNYLLKRIAPATGRFRQAVRTRADFFQLQTTINTRRLCPTSRLVAKVTGIAVQRNKAIVGQNAFAHEAGIHQDGMLKERSTYEIMRPEEVGLPKTELVLGKHSGRHALRSRVQELGYHLDETQLQQVFEAFKVLADRKKTIYDADVEALAEAVIHSGPALWTLEAFTCNAGSGTIPSAAVCLWHQDGTIFREASIGDGPVDAVFKALERITNWAEKNL